MENKLNLTPEYIEKLIRETMIFDSRIEELDYIQLDYIQRESIKRNIYLQKLRLNLNVQQSISMVHILEIILLI